MVTNDVWAMEIDLAGGSDRDASAFAIEVHFECLANSVKREHRQGESIVQQGTATDGNGD